MTPKKKLGERRCVMGSQIHSFRIKNVVLDGWCRRIRGWPREAIMMAAHGDILQSYICNKNKWTIPVFLSVDWMGFNGFLSKLDNVRQTNVIKLVRNRINDAQQQELFSTQQHFTECTAKCGQIETHQHYISCHAPPMLTQNKKMC